MDLITNINHNRGLTMTNVPEDHASEEIRDVIQVNGA